MKVRFIWFWLYLLWTCHWNRLRCLSDLCHCCKRFVHISGHIWIDKFFSEVRQLCNFSMLIYFCVETHLFHLFLGFISYILAIITISGGTFVLDMLAWVWNQVLFSNKVIRHCLNRECSCVRIFSCSVEATICWVVIVSSWVAQHNSSCCLLDCFSVSEDFFIHLISLYWYRFCLWLTKHDAAEEFILECLAKNHSLWFIVVQFLLREIDLCWDMLNCSLSASSYHWYSFRVIVPSHLEHQYKQFKLSCIKRLFRFFKQKFLVWWWIGFAYKICVSLKIAILLRRIAKSWS